MQETNICNSWQYLIQCIIGLINKGYIYYSIGYIPLSKIAKVTSIDAKLIKKYNTDQSKDQRYRNKRKGNANFKYLRYSNIFIIMHTYGNIAIENYYDDGFKDINSIPISIKIGDYISLFLKRRKVKGDSSYHYTVTLSDRTVFLLESMLIDMIKRKKSKDIIIQFNKLNALPSYAGVIKQKQKLKNFIMFHSRKHRLLIDEDLLKIKTFRKIFKNEIK